MLAFSLTALADDSLLCTRKKNYGLLQCLTKHHVTPKGWRKILTAGLPGGVGSLGVLMKQSESRELCYTRHCASSSVCFLMVF